MGDIDVVNTHENHSKVGNGARRERFYEERGDEKGLLSALRNLACRGRLNFTWELLCVSSWGELKRFGLQDSGFPER